MTETAIMCAVEELRKMNKKLEDISNYLDLMRQSINHQTKVIKYEFEEGEREA